MADATQALLDLLKGYRPRACGHGCKNKDGSPVMIEARLGETDGHSGMKIPAAVWEHSSHPQLAPHFKRVVPLTRGDT